MHPKKKVWIDTDLSVGMIRHRRPGYCDVDDGYAVLQLMKSDQIEIKGISAVFGNTTIDNAFMLCEQMNRDFAGGKYGVFKGAGEAIQLANVQTNDAVEALAAALKKEKLHIMAIGPATNVGLLLLRYPELAGQILEVVLVAGRRKETDYFSIGNQGRRAQDLNFDLDNDAFRIMFEAKVPITLCPFEISSKVWITEEDLKNLDQLDPATQWLASESRPWLGQWIEQGATGFNPFDVLASHYLIAPADIICEPRLASLEIHLDDTLLDNPRRQFKSYLLCRDFGQYPVKYCYDVVPDYHQRLLQTFQ